LIVAARSDMSYGPRILLLPEQSPIRRKLHEPTDGASAHPANARRLRMVRLADCRRPDRRFAVPHLPRQLVLAVI